MLGFLRETKEKAIQAGIDKDTGLFRSGLEEYLSIIFPNTQDWVHDKSTGIKELGKKRPDYRSESLKLIVEFDGLPHYQNPLIIKKDEESIYLYKKYGYKVVRIPYFIQLTSKVVKTLFGVDIDKSLLFDENIPSLTPNNPANPSYLCPAGLKRMVKEFINISPEQYLINIQSLEKGEDYLTGVSYLKEEYEKQINLISPTE